MRTIIFGILLLFSTNTFGQSWAWAKMGGGNSCDSSNDNVTDSIGNTYVTGYFYGTGIFNGLSFPSEGESDIFLAKYDADGNILWCKAAGGPDYDWASSVATFDSSVYVGGRYEGDIMFDSIPLQGSSSNRDAFLAKYSTDGVIQWAVRGSGGGNDQILGLDIDKEGYVYASGSFELSLGFPGGSVSSSGQVDAFVAKFTPDGQLLWIRKIGGTSNDYSYDVAVYGDRVYATGSCTTTTTFDSIAPGQSGTFVAEYDTSGAVQWVSVNGADNSAAISVDSQGNQVISGQTLGTEDFGSYIINSPNQEPYIAKYDPNGDVLWVKHGVTSNFGYGGGVAIGANDEVYATGSYSGTVTFDGVLLTSLGGTSIFVVKYDADGNQLWALSGGGQNTDQAYGLSVNQEGEAFVSGRFAYDTQYGPFVLTGSACSDMLLTKVEYVTVEISEIESDQEFRPFPNPTNSMVTVRNTAVGGSRILVFDVVGNQLTHDVKVVSANDQNIKLDLSGLANGVYLVTMGDSKYKVLKQ